MTLFNAQGMRKEHWGSPRGAQSSESVCGIIVDVHQTQQRDEWMQFSEGIASLSDWA